MHTYAAGGMDNGVDQIETTDLLTFDLRNKVPQDAATAQTNYKKLYLIRHSESLENVMIADAFLAWKNIKSLKCPTLKQLRSMGTLLTLPSDTDLSPEGEIIANNLCKIIVDMHFLDTNNIQLIVHSPLLRAKRTCDIIFERCPKTGMYY